MLRYKKGDTPIIKSNIETGKRFYRPENPLMNEVYFAGQMAAFGGKQVTITATFDHYNAYLIKEDGGTHYWIDEVFEDETPEFTKTNLKDGMIVEFRDGRRRMVLGDYLIGFECSYFCLSDFDDELNMIDKNFGEFCTRDSRIVKVYKSTTAWLNCIFDDDDLELIWERKEENPKYFNGKIRCIGWKNPYIKPIYTIGEIYDIAEGSIVDDEGRLSVFNVCSVEDLNKISFAEWEEI